MGRLSFMFVGIIIGGGTIFGAFNYHLLENQHRTAIVPQAQRQSQRNLRRYPQLHRCRLGQPSLTLGRYCRG